MKFELNEIIDKQTQFLIQRLRLENFEHGNKSGSFLANQLKINKVKTTITSVKDSKGNVTQDPDVINNAFRDFYKTLYSSQNDPSDSNINQFLGNINLPKLQPKQAMALDSPLSI